MLVNQMMKEVAPENIDALTVLLPEPQRRQAVGNWQQFQHKLKSTLHSRLAERLARRMALGEVKGELTLCGGVREGGAPLTTEDLRAVSSPIRVVWELGEHGLLYPQHSLSSSSHVLELDNGARFEVSPITRLWREIETPLLTLAVVPTSTKYDEQRQLICASRLLHYLAQLVHEIQQVQGQQASMSSILSDRISSARGELKRHLLRLVNYHIDHSYELDYLFEQHMSYDWGLHVCAWELVSEQQNPDRVGAERLSVYRKGVAALFMPGDVVHGRLCVGSENQYVTGVVQSHLPQGRLLLTDGSQVWVWASKRTVLAKDRGERGLTALCSHANINIPALIDALILFPTVESEQVVGLLSALLARMEIRAHLTISKDKTKRISFVNISPKSKQVFSQDETRSLQAMFDGLAVNEQRSSVQCMLTRDDELLRSTEYKNTQPLSVKQRSIVAVAQHIWHSLSGTRRVLSALGEQFNESMLTSQWTGNSTAQRWFRAEPSPLGELPDVLRFVIERGGLHENELPRIAPDVRPLAKSISGLTVPGGHSLAQLGHAYDGEFPYAMPKDRDRSLAMLEVLEHALWSVKDRSEQWEGEASAASTQTAEVVHLLPLHTYQSHSPRVSRGSAGSLIEWIIKRGGVAESERTRLFGSGRETVPGLLRRDGRSLEALAELYGLPNGPDVSGSDTLVSELLEELGELGELGAKSSYKPGAGGESTVRLH